MKYNLKRIPLISYIKENISTMMEDIYIRERNEKIEMDFEVLQG